MIRFTNDILPEEINQLRSSIHWKEIEVNALEKAITHTSCIVCARVGEQAVGMARVMFDYCSVAYITDVIVHPDFQGQGIGREMMKRLIEFVKINAPENVDVYFNLCASKGKEQFYTKLGFVERPAGAFGAGMTKRIRSKIS